jgi:acetyl esterase/lipase
MEPDFLPPTRSTVTHAAITVSEPDGFRPLRMDVHLPPDGDIHPLVVWVHGGGWQSGSRLTLPETIAPHGFHERHVARGYAVADVDYRLSSEVQYPAQLVDVQAAVRWLHRHASVLGLDPARFATMGESAGGHLAAMVGLLGAGDAEIRAVVNWYGAADLTDFSHTDPNTAPALLLGGAIGERLDFARFASPVHRVHPSAPPFLSVHGTADTIVPYRQSEALAEALRAHGVRADLLPVPGAGHCFEGWSDIGGLIDAGIDFLDDVLK